MTLFTRLNSLGLGSSRAPLRCRRGLWRKLLLDLRSRGAGTRESGAFLLGTSADGVRRIQSYMLYDDIDPNALVGMIDFDGSRMDTVWRECERTGLSVVADIHTHPRGFRQSGIDRANPMMPRRGHLALIVPDFARRLFTPGEIGIYELVDRNRWVDHSGQRSSYFSLEWF